MIKYSDVQYFLRVNSLGNKISRIDTSIEKASTGETNVKAVKAFIELYEELGKLLVDYKDLLEQDQKAVVKVGLTMKLQDMDIAKLFR